MSDFLGREIKQGSYIVYPGRQGSSLWVNLGHVVEITERTNWQGTTPVLRVQPIDAKTRRAIGKHVRLTEISKVTVIDLPNTSVA